MITHVLLEKTESLHRRLLTKPHKLYILLHCFWGPLAQLAEHWPFKPRVAGSNPARLTMNKWGRHRLVWPRTLVFQAGNTGPNPVGDAIFL